MEALRGALFLLASPIALAALAGLASAGWGGAAWPLMAGAAALGAAAAPWLPPQALALAPVVVVGLGALGASRALRWRPRPALALAMAGAAGVAAGLAAEFHWATPAETVGGVAAVLVLALAMLAALQALDRRPGFSPLLRVALAIVGAWVLVLAALVLLLRL